MELRWWCGPPATNTDAFKDNTVMKTPMIQVEADCPKCERKAGERCVFTTGGEAPDGFVHNERAVAWFVQRRDAAPTTPNPEIPPALTRISARFGTRLVASDDLTPPFQFVTYHTLASDVANDMCTALRAAGFQAAHDPADQLVFAGGPQRFKWTVEFEVAEAWAADGFDLTGNRALDLLERALPWADGSELGARVIARPADEDMARVQGYASVEGWRRDHTGSKS